MFAGSFWPKARFCLCGTRARLISNKRWGTLWNILGRVVVRVAIHNSGVVMRGKLAALTIGLVFLSSAVRAQERAGDAALGALSGAVVLGPIGAVAGAVVGYTAGPSIAQSWGMRRPSAGARYRTSKQARYPRDAVPAGKNELATRTDQAGGSHIASTSSKTISQPVSSKMAMPAAQGFD